MRVLGRGWGKSRPLRFGLGAFGWVHQGPFSLLELELEPELGTRNPSSGNLDFSEFKNHQNLDLDFG